MRCWLSSDALLSLSLSLSLVVGMGLHVTRDLRMTGSENNKWGAYHPTLNAPGPVQVASAESGGVDLAFLRAGARGRTRRPEIPSSSRSLEKAPQEGHADERGGAGGADSVGKKREARAPEMSTKKKKAFTRALEGYL